MEQKVNSRSVMSDQVDKSLWIPEQEMDMVLALRLPQNMFFCYARVVPEGVSVLLGPKHHNFWTRTSP